jgi:hypothetical protein
VTSSGQKDAERLLPEEQLLILRAALLPGPEGRAAGSAWLAQVDLERLGRASGRLLPLLYDRFLMDGVDHSLMPMLKGVKRHAWYRNSMLFHRASEAICALGQAGIEVMAIHGAAMTAGYYHDWGIRPMEDVDLLVHHNQVNAAIEVLCRRSWKPLEPWFERNGYSDLTRRYEDAMHFPHSSGQRLDLHWNLLPFCLGPGADDDFWAASKETTLDAQPVRIPDPADQLLHICVQGAAWDLPAPIRWVPDAVTVLRAAPDLDWDRFLFQARNRRLTLLAGGALEYIRQNFGDLVPPDLLSRVRQTPVSAFDKFELRWILKPPTSMIGIMVKALCRYWRLSEKMPLWKTALSFPDFLCCQLRLDRKRQLPADICRRVARRMRRRLQSQPA